ncbi:pancreatic triacylglycerol lipase-like [Gastrophryne carolinensis]
MVVAVQQLQYTSVDSHKRGNRRSQGTPRILHVELILVARSSWVWGVNRVFPSWKVFQAFLHVQMLLMWMISICFLGTVHGAEVCYNRLGCFSTIKPWAWTKERPLAKLPWTPEEIDTRFLLYNPNSPDYQEISVGSLPSIFSSNFQPTKKTHLIIHGFTASANSAWISDMCQELYRVENGNCIAVDWSKGANAQYSQAANNIRVVGAEISNFIDVLLSNLSYSPANIHLIGHSLGAHAAGEAGKRRSGIARITGLDPAEPYFQNTPTEVRLDLSDAKLVDVIHTDAGPFIPDLGFGMSQVIGHLDFFPNGGVHMPGCPLNTEVHYTEVDEIWSSGKGSKSFLTCNHQKAITYYTESISNASLFVSHPCTDWSTFQTGSCKTCPSAGCPKMGHYAETYDGVTSASQVFYLSTP